VSYCVNPNCPRPENSDQDSICAACGSSLRLRDRYKAMRPLGKGGFGATFLAADEGLPGHPTCVIKQLRPNSQSPSVLKMARELFEREAFTLGKIGNHPQIPRLLDYFIEDKNFYLVQEYVEGETLKQEFERRGIFSEVDIRKVLQEIMPALGFIHDCGVIHRDIKPANIIRRKQDGQLVLIDFGAVSTQVNKSTVGEDAGEEDPGALLTNFAIGTPGFAPPEQMAMRPVYSSDLYAVAMSCLYLLTGRSPKDFGHDPYTGQINWRSQIQVSTYLTAVFDRMLQPTVTQRFRTASEVLQALSGGDSSPTAPTSTSTPDSAAAPILSSISVASPQNRAAPLPNSRIQAARNLASSQAGNTQFSVDATQGYTRFGKDLRGGRKVIAEYSHGKRNFASLDLAKASLASATLTGIVLSRSKLTETDFCQANLVGASFQGSIMTQAKLNGANLSQAKMQRAILTKADLGGACLAQADLREATLQFAYLSKADLTGANLSGANLKGAYLSQANLRGANLCGADLKGAKVTDEQLATAKTNWSTIRPDGSKRLF
jgi:serine/threonine protein kinase, bacterial